MERGRRETGKEGGEEGGGRDELYGKGIVKNGRQR